MAKNKFEMTLDFYKYLFFLKKSEGIRMIISLVIFLISLATIIHGYTDFEKIELSNFFVLALFVFSLINVIWDGLGKLAEIKSFTGSDREITMIKKTTIIKENFAFELKSIGYGQGKKNWIFENFSYNDLEEYRVIRSKELNQYLWDNTLRLEIDMKRRDRVQGFILRNRNIVAPFFQYKYYNSIKNEQFFFNEDKLCMASDISKDRDYIRCHRSNYFNSFLTNEICTYALQRIEDATIIYDASNFYPCEYNEKEKLYYLQPIDKSLMNNHIGVSNLALTKDNYLIIRKQNEKSQQNRNKYMPTGSGSCDWSDMRGSSFIDTIVYAMKRELWEENGSKRISPTAEDIGQTKVLGFFRWLQRGGKPEFVGITKLKCTLDEMEVNTDEFIDISNKGNMDTFKLDDIDEIPQVVSEIKDGGNISVPLHMCLDALENFYLARPEELRQFFGL